MTLKSTTLDLFTAFCEETNKNADTCRSYRATLNAFTRYMEKDISDCGEADAKAYTDYLLSCVPTGKLSIKTVYNKITVLSKICEYAQSVAPAYGFCEGYTNYFSLVERPDYNIHVNPTTLLTLDDYNTLITNLSVNDKLLYAAVLLSATVGLKTSDLVNLKTNNIVKDIDDRYLYISKNIKDTDYIIIPDNVMYALNEYRKSVNSESPFFFVSQRTPQFTVRGLEKRLRQRIEKLDLPSVTFNDLRNAAAVYMLSNSDYTKEDVAKLLRVDCMWVNRYDRAVSAVKNETALTFTPKKLGRYTDLRALSDEQVLSILSKTKPVKITLYATTFDAINDNVYSKGNAFSDSIYTVDAPFCISETSEGEKYWLNNMSCGNMTSTTQTAYNYLLKYIDAKSLNALFTSSKVVVTLGYSKPAIETIPLEKTISSSFGSFFIANASLILKVSEKNLTTYHIESFLGEDYTITPYDRNEAIKYGLYLNFYGETVVASRVYSNGSGRQIWI